MPRKPTGQLILRPTGYYLRYWAVVDGERVRLPVALGTRHLAAAKVKRDRLLAEAAATPVGTTGTTRKAIKASAKREETFKQTALRVHKLRRKVIRARNADFGLSLMRRHAFELIGDMPAADVTAADINLVLDAVAASGVDRGSVDAARNHIAAVFKQLKREAAITKNPVDDVTMPTFASKVTRERTVLTDAELGVYLAWQHPSPGRRMGVLERQTMSCISRTFGGVRTGDLHTMRWETFDVEQGAFGWGYAPRQKKRRPQLLEVPAMLRPMLRQWWALAGEPQSGLMFPVRRENCSNNRIGLERQNVSHAKAFRRDLARAFEAAKADDNTAAPRRGSRRYRELFEETEVTRPVDFHSWRRSYCQALDDAGASPQQAAALAGHDNLSVHAQYLRNAGKMRRMPEEALPKLEKAPAKGTAMGFDGVRLSATSADDAETPAKGMVGHKRIMQGSSRQSLDEDTKPLETSGLRLVRGDVKAPAKPFENGGLVELLREADAAVLAGELRRVRELLACALERAERRERRVRRR